MHKWLADREKEKGTGKFDVKDTGYSKRYTRRHEEEPEDDDTDAPVSKGGAKKGRKTVGAGKGKKIGAKVRGTSKLHRPDAIAEEDMDEGWRGGGLGEPPLVKTRRSKAETAYREIADFLRSPQNGIEPRARQHLMRLVDELAQQATKTKEMPVAEKAPPGAKAERMVKHIKKGYAKDGKLTPKEKSIAYATAWKAHNKGQVEEEGGKPDFLDLDKDGNKKEPMKQAAKQAKKKSKKLQLQVL
jgi:hypothetical protein